MSENEKETGASAPRTRPSGRGRGLTALFGDAAVEAPVLATPGAAAKAAPVAAGDSVQHVSVGSIRPLPNQPRRHFDEAAIVAGSEADWTSDRSGVLVGERLMKRYGWKLGDKFALQGDFYPTRLELTVRAVYRGPDESGVYF